MRWILLCLVFVAGCVEIPVTELSNETTVYYIESLADKKTVFETIRITETGFDPNIITVERGSILQLEVVNDVSTSVTFIVPEFGIDYRMNRLGSFVITLNAERTGQFYFEDRGKRRGIINVK